MAGDRGRRNKPPDGRTECPTLETGAEIIPLDNLQKSRNLPIEIVDCLGMVHRD